MPAASSLPQRTVVSSGAADVTIAAAATGKVHRVIAFLFTADDAATVRFESTAGGTALTGDMAMVAGVPVVGSFNPEGWCETASGGLLNLEVTGTGPVNGVVVYVTI